MEPWGWILVYLAGFTLFQLLLVRYFSEDRSLGGVSLESNEASPPQSGERGRSVGERDGRSREAADEGAEGVRCHQCGTENADEQPYTYCRECLAQLR
ncbi:DUF7577 domain-containing protein [Halosimplex halophilum]|uniref:DUF7577 domain-containing protein n=1 Tax=Halosimplex halophilum TaxID=2559572 RepID=UPI00107FD068|nr:hypothetical protein [Halosimplex halophilum]